MKFDKKRETGLSGSVCPALDLLLYFRQPAHALQGNDDYHERNDPRDYRAGKVFTCLVFAGHRPDNQHYPAENWNCPYEKDEHPFRHRYVVSVVWATHTASVM